jgi:hypothetical protein
VTPGSAGAARDAARRILDHPPFVSSSDHPPNLLHGVLSSLGSFLHYVFGGALRWLFNHTLAPVARALDGHDGPWWALATAAAAFVVGAGVVVVLWNRRAHHRERAVMAVRVGATHVTATEYEHRAAAASAAGAYANAVRWSFCAGVERLVESGALRDGRSRTDRQVRDALDLTQLARLVYDHERIVYGRGSATARDADAARDGWRDVIDAAHGARREPTEARAS